MKEGIRTFIIVLCTVLFTLAWATSLTAPTFAAGSISGQVTAAGAPIVGSMVTLWAASTSAPKQLAQARTDAAGRFALNVAAAVGNDDILYLVAKGGRPDANKASGENPASVAGGVLSTPLQNQCGILIQGG